MAAPQPQRPNPSEAFEAVVNIELTREDHQVYGQGRMASDQPNNKFVEEFIVQDDRYHQEIRVLNLWRYDMDTVWCCRQFNDWLTRFRLDLHDQQRQPLRLREPHRDPAHARFLELAGQCHLCWRPPRPRSRSA